MTNKRRQTDQYTLKLLTEWIIKLLVPIVVGIMASYIAFRTHIATADIHMPLEKKEEKFVGRLEYQADNRTRDNQFSNIAEHLKEIKDLIKAHR